VCAETNPAGRIGRLYALVLGREPSTEESGWAGAFVAAAATPARGWQDLAQALLVSNEFVFVD
jgi:hypothetical protein